jgi:hypothetical protein
VAWFGVAAWDVGHDWMLTSASVMALASFGLVLVAVRIFAMFAQWCSRACAGESCVVTLVFGMHAHSECEVVRLRASPAKRGVQPWLRCTRVTFVSMCRKQACVNGERASTHMALDGQVAWLGALLGCFGRGASALCVSRVAC